MRDYLPDERVQIHHEIIRHQHDANLRPIGRTRSGGRLSRRQGPLRSVKLRIVCEKCNNGWMSGLQKKTKPILTAFIEGNWRKLTPAEQRTLAAWAAMFTMAVEYGDPETAATSSTFLAPGRAAFLTFSGSDGPIKPRQLAAVGMLARNVDLRRIWPPSALFRGTPPRPIPFIAGQVWIFCDTLVETIRRDN